MSVIASLVLKIGADIADLKTSMEKATSFMQSAAKAVVGAWTLERVISSVASFTGEIINSAGAMVDMAGKTGLTLDTIQRMDYVAGQTGGTLDDFTTAAFKLGAAIAGGGPSVERAVEKLGLSFATLRTMSPDDQFKTVAGALHNMSNENERNRIGLDLFSKTFQAIVPAIAEGYDEMAQHAHVSGDEQIKALDTLGDAWDEFVKNRKKDATDFLGSMVLAGEGAGKIGIWNVLDLIIKQGPAAVATLSAVGEAAQTAGKQIKVPVPPADPIIAYKQHIQELQSAVVAFSPAQEDLIRQGIAVGDSAHDIADGLKLSERAVSSFMETEKKAAQEQKELDKAIRELDSAGESWAQTLADLDPLEVKAIKNYMDAGVSQHALAVAYGYTDSQISAVAKSIEAESALTRLANDNAKQGLSELTSLWTEYDNLRATHGKTTTDQQIAGIQAWAAEVQRAAETAGTATQQFYDTLAAVTAEKTKDVLTDWKAINDELNNNTQNGLQQVADKARATFEEAKSHVGEFSDQTIQHFRDLADQAQISADSWGTSVEGIAGAISKSEPDIAAASAQAAGSIQNNFLAVFGNVESHARDMCDSVTGAMRSMQMDQAYRDAGFSVDSTGPAFLMQQHQAQGHTIAGMPHLASGGVVSRPTVALIGESGPEAVVPLDRAGMGGSNISVSITVNGAMDGPSAARAGQQAADAIIARLRAQGVRL